MKFDDVFKRNFAKQLTINKKKFSQDLVTLVTKSCENPFNISLSLKLVLEDRPINLRNVQNIIKETLSDDSNPYYDGRKIHFNITKQENDRPLNVERMYCLNDNNFSIFYADKFNIAFFDEIKTFHIIHDQRTNKYPNNIVDAKNFTLMIEDILSNLYPEYIFSKKYSSKTHRFVREISPGYFLAIEYNRHLFEQELKRRIHIPDFRIVLFNENFNRKVQENEYILGNNDDILFLDKLANPFFSPPVVDISTIFSRLSFKDEYLFNIEQLINKDSDLFFRKYTNYQMVINQYYTSSYLDYIIKSIVGIVENKLINEDFKYSQFEIEKIFERTTFLQKFIPDSLGKLDNAFKKKLISKSNYDSQIKIIEISKIELDKNLKILKETDIIMDIG